jgi:putative colanic acid biosysnthesis UDP-glucose lipid carrier transferase
MESASTRIVVSQGGNSFASFIKRFVDPIVILLVQVVVWWRWSMPFDVVFLVTAVVVFSLSFPGDMPFRTRQFRLFGRILGEWVPTAVAMLVLAWASKTLYSLHPHALIAWAVGTPLAVWSVHLVSPWLAPKVFGAAKPVFAVLVGVNEQGLKVVANLNDDTIAGVRVVGCFDDRDAQRFPIGNTVPLIGNFGDVAEYVKSNAVGIIYITLPMASHPRLLKLLDDLRDTTASIYFVPDFFMFDLIQARVDTVGEIPVLAITESPFSGMASVAKRWSDIAIALVALVLTAPLLLVVGLIVKFSSPGPVLFKQRRYGLDGQQISVWKFRSMRTMDDGDQIKQAQLGDERITAIGRFIRKTSIDELPQFVNVLQGHMSVVGPRPHAVAHNETFRKVIKGYMVRHKIKPGITGWAQVNGARGETDTVEKMQRRIELDLEYLRQWSLSLDFKIIAKTVVLVFRDPNAY